MLQAVVKAARRRSVLGPALSLAASMGLAVTGSGAAAATIEPVQRASCSLRLDGPIEAGDLDRFRKATAAQSGGGNVSLCLNSPGGSYAEGMRIIEFMLGSPASFRTVVDHGEECVSVCALMFLAGHYKKAGDKAKLPDRKLHVRGMLGFHGPYIKPGAASYDPALVAAAHSAGLKAVGQLLALDEEALFPLSLLGAGLAKGADEFMYVETVGQAGGWAIDLLGYRKPHSFTTNELEQACQNYDAWNVFNESPLSPRPDLTVAASPKVVFQGHKFHRVSDGFGGEGTYQCFVDGFDGGAKGLFLKVQVGSAGDAGVRQAAAVLQKEVANGGAAPTGPGTPLFYIHPPSKLLVTIAED
jgi:hypothetical protein